MIAGLCLIAAGLTAFAFGHDIGAALGAAIVRRLGL